MRRSRFTGEQVIGILGTSGRRRRGSTTPWSRRGHGRSDGRRYWTTGVHATLEDLARANGVNATYVSRNLRLTLLAPEIVEAILDGRQPAGLQLDDLLEAFPLDWGGKSSAAGAGGSERQPSSGSVRRGGRSVRKPAAAQVHWTAISCLQNGPHGAVRSPMTKARYRRSYDTAAAQLRGRKQTLLIVPLRTICYHFGHRQRLCIATRRGINMHFKIRSKRENGHERLLAVTFSCGGRSDCCAATNGTVN